MKKTFKVLSLILAMAMLVFAFTACSSNDSDKDANAEFDYSSGLDENGHFKDINALDYVTLPEDYASITVPQADRTVTNDEVLSQIDSYLNQYTTVEQVTNRSVKNGDTINMDFEGKIDGVAFDGGTASSQKAVIGTSTYIEGFLEQIVGHTPGETFDINVTFPEVYENNPDLAGKDAVFTITLNYIEEEVVPTLNDAFVSEHFATSEGWNNVADMRAGIKALLEKSKVTEFVENYMMQNSTVSEIPQSVRDYEVALLEKQYEATAQSYGMEFSDFLNQAFGVSSFDELSEQLGDTIDESAKYSLMIQAVAEDANIEITEDTLKSYFKSNFFNEDYSPYVEKYGEPYVKMAVLNDNVVDYLTDNAK